jgi:hypothetical protein
MSVQLIKDLKNGLPGVSQNTPFCATMSQPGERLKAAPNGGSARSSAVSVSYDE